MDGPLERDLLRRWVRLCQAEMISVNTFANLQLALRHPRVSLEGLHMLTIRAEDGTLERNLPLSMHPMEVGSPATLRLREGLPVYISSQRMPCDRFVPDCGTDSAFARPYHAPAHGYGYRFDEWEREAVWVEDILADEFLLELELDWYYNWHYAFPQQSAQSPTQQPMLPGQQNPNQSDETAQQQRQSPTRQTPTLNRSDPTQHDDTPEQALQPPGPTTASSVFPNYSRNPEAEPREDLAADPVTIQNEQQPAPWTQLSPVAVEEMEEQFVKPTPSNESGIPPYWFNDLLKQLGIDVTVSDNFDDDTFKKFPRRELNTIQNGLNKPCSALALELARREHYAPGWQEHLRQKIRLVVPGTLLQMPVVEPLMDSNLPIDDPNIIHIRCGPLIAKQRFTIVLKREGETICFLSGTGTMPGSSDECFHLLHESQRAEREREERRRADSNLSALPRAVYFAGSRNLLSKPTYFRYADVKQVNLGYVRIEKEGVLSGDGLSTVIDLQNGRYG